MEYIDRPVKIPLLQFQERIMEAVFYLESAISLLPEQHQQIRNFS